MKNIGGTCESKQTFEFQTEECCSTEGCCAYH